MTSYLDYTDEQLRREVWLLEAEMERRRLAEHAKQLALSEPDNTDLEYVEYLWASEAGGSLTDAEDGPRVLRWLWEATWLAHDAQYGRAPTVAHLARALVEHLEALALGGGGEDTTDVRDMAEQPQFGGRGCKCRLYDDGDGESGPHLAVDLHEECPLHSHLLEGAVPDVPWPGDVDSGRLTDAGYERPQAYSEAARVREALHDDATVSNEEYGRLVAEADEADEAREWQAEAEPQEATLCRVHEAGACPPGCPDAYTYEDEPTTTTKEIS